MGKASRDKMPSFKKKKKKKKASIGSYCHTPNALGVFCVPVPVVGCASAVGVGAEGATVVVGTVVVEAPTVAV